MATSVFSKGYRKKPAPNPKGSGYPRASRHPTGGTSGDLSIPGYEPRTPTVAYDPAAPPSAVQRAIRSPASSGLGRVLLQVSDLLSPGPSTRDIAQAAANLGAKPQKTVPGELADAVKSGIEDLGQVVGKGAALVAKVPKTKVERPKVLGTPTVAQLAAAAETGKLGRTQRGKITVPATRKAARELLAARAAVAQSRGGGDSVEAQIGRYLLNHGLNRKGAAGILGNAYAESSLQPGATGYGGGGLWGFTAHPNSLSDLQGYAQAQGKSWEDPKVQTEFLLQHVAPETVQEVNAAANPADAARVFMERFERPGIPRQGVREQAAQQAFTGPWSKPDPQAVQALQVAKQNARAVGINPTPFNGDVKPGAGPNLVTVRADAQGMLEWAESALGTVEGSAKAERWGAQFGLNTVSQPWCANFVSNGLLRRGFGPSQLPGNPNFVPSYEEWANEGRYATNVGTDLSKAKPGDLLAFSGEHIGIYAGNGEMISGNSSDAVNRTAASDGSYPLTAIIRPRYQGGTVQVDAGQPLPGSTPGSALGGIATGGAAAPGATVAEGSAASRTQGGAVAPSAIPVSELLQTLGLAPNVGTAQPVEGEEGTLEELLRRLG